MKRKVRSGVFETNSSSMHSVTFDNYGANISSLDVDELTNKVIAEFGEFGWEVRDYRSPEVKLSYLLTMAAYELEHKADGKVNSVEAFYETEGFKLINEAVAEHCNCAGVVLPDGCMRIREDSWDPGHPYLDFDGYIDHQSVYASVAKFLEEYNCDAEKFIFDTSVVLHTDNDNH